MNEQPINPLAAFEVADTAILDVNGPDGQPLLHQGQPTRIELYGPGSTVHAQAQAKIEAAGITRAMSAMRGKAPKDIADDAVRLRAEKLATCTACLINFPPGVTPLAIYSNRKLGYITEQVAKFIEDWANFPSGSPKT